MPILVPKFYLTDVKKDPVLRIEIFVHIPKNAGTFYVENAKNDYFVYFEGHHNATFYRTLLNMDFRSALLEKFKKDDLVATVTYFVRNPIERFLSNYYYAKMTKSYHHSIDGNARHGIHPDYYYLARFPNIKDFVAYIKDFPNEITNGVLKHQGWAPQYTWLVDPITGDFVQRSSFNCSVNVSIKSASELNKANAINKSSYGDDLQLLDKDDYLFIKSLYSRDYNQFQISDFNIPGTDEYV